MSKKERIAIVGGGGHAKVLIALIKKRGVYDIVGIVDPNLTKGSLLLQIPVLGDDSFLENLSRQGVRKICLGVGTVKVSDTRRKLYEKVKTIGFDVPCMIHPDAVVLEDVTINEGVQIMAGAIIQPGSFIGENAIINNRAIVDHGCRINKYVHVCPGAVISGGCVIGENSFIGAGATLIHNITIGSNAIVGAGAVVIHNVLDNAIVKGMPAK